MAEIFRSARRQQRLSQQQVATLTDGGPGQISRTAISDIERGRNLPGLETLVSLSQALHIDPAEVLERVGLALTDPVDLTDSSIEVLRQRAEELFWAGCYRSALGVYDAMLQRLALDPPDDETELLRMRARVEINRAVTLRQCSALKASKATAERAIELSRQIPDLQAEAYTVLASLHAHEGLFVLALVAAEQAVALSAEAGPAVQATAWNQQGNVLHRAGRFEEARQAFLHARKYAIQAHDHHNMISTEGNIGACLMDLGRRGQARIRFTKAVELARKYADPAAEAFWLVELGQLMFGEKDLAVADRFAQAALKIAKPADRVLTVFRAEWLRHQIVRQRNPRAGDERRLAHIKKLYLRVKRHRGLAIIKEFEQSILSAETGRPEEDPDA